MIPFHKYQGTGNDFVMIDQREKKYVDPTNEKLIKRLCERRFGIGADGVILLQNHPDYDFEMIYFNADGRPSSMCGNGGRCITAFAHHLGHIEDTTTFLAVDGPHEARVREDGWVELKMSDVDQVEQNDDAYILDTGSPHYITFVEDIDDINVYENGQAIRYSSRFKKEGINVNFVEKTEAGIIVATYERGVEDETLSCGTGVTAAAIAYLLESKAQLPATVSIDSKGGALAVRLDRSPDTGFTDIWLCGPATRVFGGEIFSDQ